MDENTKSTEAIDSAEDDLAMLPDGWGEGDDFFEVDSWTGAASADEQKDDAASQDDHEVETEDAEEGTTTADDAAEDSSDAGKPTTPKGKGKLKFSATIDHESKDVELDETELPTIYQKAQVTDRVQAKVARMQPVYDKATRTAKILGYSTVEEMLQAAEDSFRDGEIEKLVSEGTQKDVAEDYVRRKLKDAETKEEEPPKAEKTSDAERYKSEVSALIELRPEFGKQGARLPDEVVSEFISTGRPLSVVYLEYEARQNQAKYDALLKENKKLKQNAEAASRAPVRGVSRGGKTDTKADDPFLAGFNADD